MFTLSFLGVSGTPNKSATNPKPHQFRSTQIEAVSSCSSAARRTSSLEQAQLTSSARGLRGRDPVAISAESPLFRLGSFSGERHVPRAEFPRAMTPWQWLIDSMIDTWNFMKFHCNGLRKRCSRGSTGFTNKPQGMKTRPTVEIGGEKVEILFCPRVFFPQNAHLRVATIFSQDLWQTFVPFTSVHYFLYFWVSALEMPGFNTAMDSWKRGASWRFPAEVSNFLQLEHGIDMRLICNTLIYILYCTCNIM